MSNRPLTRTLGLLLLALSLVAEVRAQADTAAQLKAQILIKALRFVDWPAASLGPGQPLHLCLADDSPLAQALGALAAPAVNEHALRLRALRDRQLAACHVALVGPAQDWSGVATGATLLVAEAPGMLDRGAMLNLQVEDGRVVFDVDLDATRRAGLEISAKLLRLARYVRKR
ncbi:YfiR family protein [Roseateles microcysteis]|uniref:YfiR family protein n=1 Tax=Roseateles microcysteis TaxID=3119057 RepID=UPI002FE502EC